MDRELSSLYVTDADHGRSSLLSQFPAKTGTSAEKVYWIYKDRVADQERRKMKWQYIKP